MEILPTPTRSDGSVRLISQRTSAQGRQWATLITVLPILARPPVTLVNEMSHSNLYGRNGAARALARAARTRSLISGQSAKHQGLVITWSSIKPHTVPTMLMMSGCLRVNNSRGLRKKVAGSLSSQATRNFASLLHVGSSRHTSTLVAQNMDRHKATRGLRLGDNAFIPLHIEMATKRSLTCVQWWLEPNTGHLCWLVIWSRSFEWRYSQSPIVDAGTPQLLPFLSRYSTIINMYLLPPVPVAQMSRSPYPEY